MRIGTELERKGMVGQWKADRGRSRLIWGDGGVWGRRVGNEGDSVGDPARGAAQGVLGDLGGRGGCGLKRTILWLLVCLMRKMGAL